MTNARPRPGEAGTGAVIAGSGQATRPAGLALFVSALQGSLAAGSAVGGVIYDAKGPGGPLVLAAVVAAAGSLSLLGRAGAAISAPSAGRSSRKHRTTTALKLPFAAMPAAAQKELPCPTTRKELPCPTRL